MSKKIQDVMDVKGEGWLYSNIVEDHFFSPRNVMKKGIDPKDFNAYGEVGAMACGDIMKIWLKIENDKIVDFKWKTFGCASAIASTSVLSQMAIGMNVDDAYMVSANDIVEALGGLPKRKIHCSILGDQGLRKAIDNYRNTKN